MIANILTADFNITIIKFLQQFSNPFLDKLAEFITMTGEQYFSIGLILVIYLCISKNLGYRLGFASLFSNSINSLVKNIFKVPRPIGTSGVRSLRLETAGGYSFPSGHTQNASVLWTNLMKNIKRPWIYTLGTVMIVSVALSRLYLGVHRPVDVFFGFIFGALSMFIVNRIFDCKEVKATVCGLLILIAVSLTVTTAYGDSDLYKQFGAMIGFFIGYLIEKSFIKFKEKASVTQNMIKILIAVIGYVILELGLKAILPNFAIFAGLRYFLIILWVTIGVTSIIKKFKLYL